MDDKKLDSTSNLKNLNLTDGSIFMVGNKQVQVLDLVTESDSTEVEQTNSIPCSLPPRKRPKLLINISSPDILVMPDPNIDHQVNIIK